MEATITNSKNARKISKDRILPSPIGSWRKKANFLREKIRNSFMNLGRGSRDWRNLTPIRR